MMIFDIQTPDYRNNNMYQFVTRYTGGGAEACVHLTRKQIEERCIEKIGPGLLIDDGNNLYWKTEEKVDKPFYDVGL